MIDPQQIEPRGARVLVEIDDSPEMMIGNIEIVRLPDRDGDRKVVPVKGTVIAVGPEASDVNIGDYVILDKYHGVVLSSVTASSPSLILVKEAFVMLIVEGERGGE